MNGAVRPQIRRYVVQRLRMKGDDALVDDGDALFSSGRLDSLDAVEMIMHVENEYGINFSRIDFDLTRLDSIDSIATLIAGP